MYFLGYDCGTSSIKASLLEAETGLVVGSAASPGEEEMGVFSLRPGWAEQDVEEWWGNLRSATGAVLAEAGVGPGEIKAIGISYQMHGLVLVDRAGRALRRAIIWCDSRAAEVGERAFREVGAEVCLGRLLNSPGNFTAAKLRWVKEHEPEVYGRADKAMLPGDYVALRMTGEAATTVSGLSEMILWDFGQGRRAEFLLERLGIDGGLLPEVVGTFGRQGELTAGAAGELGLAAGTPVTYRAGDQPNNAFSLSVLEPGEVAATAGTSGVIYGVSEVARHDPGSRVNTFVHVNHGAGRERLGVLLCVNGAGIENSWMRKVVGAGEEKRRPRAGSPRHGGGADYAGMNELAAGVGVGSEGVCVLPFGNGAERILGNREVGAIIGGLNFHVHGREHLFRAGQEGVAFAMNYGLGIMREMGAEVRTIRAGRANMFLSGVFREALCNVTGAVIELYDTDGAAGAARGAGLGAGVYRDFREAFVGLERMAVIEPDGRLEAAYGQAWQRWLELLKKHAGV